MLRVAHGKSVSGKHVPVSDQIVPIRVPNESRRRSELGFVEEEINRQGRNGIDINGEK